MTMWPISTRVNKPDKRLVSPKTRRAFRFPAPEIHPKPRFIAISVAQFGAA